MTAPEQPDPIPEDETARMAARQAMDYDAPILAEPTVDGPVPQWSGGDLDA